MSRSNSMEQTGLGFGFQVDSKIIGDVNKNEHTCDVKGCNQKSFIIAFSDRINWGIYLCKFHYSLTIMMDGAETNYNDYLGNLGEKNRRFKLK